MAAGGMAWLASPGAAVVKPSLAGSASSGEPLQRRLEIAGEVRAVHLEVAQDPMQVRVGQVDDLDQPVRELDVRVASELAERHRSFGRLEHERVQLAE